MKLYFFFFFFQAEDGIRDFHVTGVQTCALPISNGREARHADDGAGAGRACPTRGDHRGAGPRPFEPSRAAARPARPHCGRGRHRRPVEGRRPPHGRKLAMVDWKKDIKLSDLLRKRDKTDPADAEAPTAEVEPAKPE